MKASTSRPSSTTATKGTCQRYNNNVRLVGKAEVTNPSGAGNTGRVADVVAPT